MGFSIQQVRKLKASLRRQHVRERQVDGISLHYLEGWHIVSEANRIFGFDGWDRETVSSECVWRHPVDGGFAAAYLMRVKIRVRAGDGTLVREGLGSGEAIAPTPGQAHERAAKAAETDATKRALSTFGNSFGLTLYKGNLDSARKRKPLKTASRPSPAEGAVLNPTSEVACETRPYSQGRSRIAGAANRIDKSVLAIGEPRRIRSKDHLRFVATVPCLVCGRLPSQAHHLRFMQPRALSLKVSDEFTVPLCALHHRDLHLAGNELSWWEAKNIDPAPEAENLWRGGEDAAERSLHAIIEDQPRPIGADAPLK
jgi:hypothetical protein